MLVRRGRWYMARMTVGVDHQLRTDESFRARETPHHYRGLSPLEEIGTGMVSQFRLDAMHLVYLGVVKRMLSFLFFRRSVVRLRDDQIEGINDLLSNISSHFPEDFNRPPRRVGTAKKKSKLKATEYRRFILYDAIVVLKEHVPTRVYRCFLLVHCAIVILCSADKFREMNDVAKILLKRFVVYVSRVFGIEFVSYNVHSLEHLAQECLDTDSPLDLFSAFKFENFMRTVLRALQTTVKPLQQLARRDAECKGKLLKPKGRVNNNVKLLNEQPLKPEAFHGRQFQRLVKRRFSLSTRVGNSCFRTQNGDIVLLSNIIDSAERGVILAGRKFQVKEDFYDFPLESSRLGILSVSHLEGIRRYWKLEHVDVKMVAVPNGEDYVCFPPGPFMCLGILDYFALVLVSFSWNIFVLLQYFCEGVVHILFVFVAVLCP